MLKKFLCVILAACIILAVPSVYAQTEEGAAVSFIGENSEGLYAHAVLNDSETEAWTLWQSAEDEKGNILKPSEKYFFMPSGGDNQKAEIYNAYSSAVTIGKAEIPAKSSAVIEYAENNPVSVKIGSKSYRLTFMHSTAEAAIFVNNTNADGKGMDLYEFISESKSNSASASGAIVEADGTVDNTAVKKIKGRGNTTWEKAKKPFNITYSSTVSIAGMPKSKKYALLANYQDASLARNRILYDLSDAVGMPYASDSRFVDFYINGVYYGSYQCAQKIEVGKNDLINDISDSDYLTDENTLAQEFSFCLEIDPSYSSDDYHTNASSTELTIKSPEIAEGEPFYSEVKEFAAQKFTALHSALRRTATAETLSEYMDVDSFAKIYLINELGKNWDSGVSSFYMVYKKSPDGKYRFYASPVWDYDNSLGNAVGIDGELRYSGVNDYTAYSGWWCRYKGKKSEDKTSNNIVNRCAQNNAILARASQLWIEEFMPRIRRFFYSDSKEGELYSASYYYELLKGSAEMNYARGWLLNTGDWIADHSKLKKALYFGSLYKVDSTYTTYYNDFEGEFNFTIDWMKSRAAWLTKEFYRLYVPSSGDVNGDGKITISDATYIQLYLADKTPDKFDEAAADYNKDDKIDIDDATLIQRILLI